jgi:small-conductance mechanosensitive channel
VLTLLGDALAAGWPAVLTLFLTALAIAAVAAIFARKPALAEKHGLLRGLLLLLLLGLGAVALILTLPIGPGTRSDLLTLLGIVVSAVIALSATTFVGNAMAGLLLRSVRSFRPGDFIQVSGHFGRVSEFGVFHTEIQTPESDLTTLPNLLLVTNPVTVMRASGTVIHAEVSLGYDVPHVLVERVLEQAARDAGLAGPFVQVRCLGDFAVTYRCSGMLEDLSKLIGAESVLRARMLDQLHEHGVEIVSPTFMNQRRLGEERRFVPEPPSARAARAEVPPAPEEAAVFGKAARAATLEQLRARRAAALEERERLVNRREEVKSDEDECARAETALERLQVYLDFLDERIGREEKRHRSET